MQHSSIQETVWHWLRCQRESWLANTFMRKRLQKCCWESHLLIHDRLVKQELLVNGDQINQTVAVSHSSTGDRGIEGPGLGAWMSQILICVHLQLHVPVPGARGWGLVNASLGHFYTSWLEWKELLSYLRFEQVVSNFHLVILLSTLNIWEWYNKIHG